MSNSKEQAQAQFDCIYEMVQSYEMDWIRLEELREDADELDEEDTLELKELNEIAGDYEDQDDVIEVMRDNALSCEVRSGWSGNSADLEAEEFRIVLCTGGPHVEIMGELNQFKEPDRAWIQYSDWGTGMTTLPLSVSDGEALLTYCQQFYFGE